MKRDDLSLQSSEGTPSSTPILADPPRSLRDEMAMVIAAGIWANPGTTGGDGRGLEPLFLTIALHSYAQADALMAVRRGVVVPKLPEAQDVFDAGRQA